MHTLHLRLYLLNAPAAFLFSRVAALADSREQVGIPTPDSTW